jgi:hypothetical protein
MLFPLGGHEHLVVHEHLKAGWIGGQPGGKSLQIHVYLGRLCQCVSISFKFKTSQTFKVAESAVSSLNLSALAQVNLAGSSEWRSLHFLRKLEAE